MQRTADFQDQIAAACPPEAAGVVDDATALDAAVDMRDAHARRAMRRLAACCARVRARPRGFLVGMMIVTWSRVNARKPRAWSHRLPAGNGYGVLSAIRLAWMLPA
jgi:hypothetical protein